VGDSDKHSSLLNTELFTKNFII